MGPRQKTCSSSPHTILFSLHLMTTTHTTRTPHPPQRRRSKGTGPPPRVRGESEKIRQRDLWTTSGNVAFRQESWVNPSPADEKLRPRSQTRNDKRDGGEGCSFFKWHLFIGFGTSPSSNINLNAFAQNRRKVTFYHPPAPEEPCSRYRAGYCQRKGDQGSILIGAFVIFLKLHKPLTQNWIFLFRST